MDEMDLEGGAKRAALQQIREMAHDAMGERLRAKAPQPPEPVPPQAMPGGNEILSSDEVALAPGAQEDDEARLMALAARYS